MKQKIYLILFKDGSLQTSKVQPIPENYQIGARVFEADSKLTIGDISDWSGRGYPSETLYIKEF